MVKTPLPWDTYSHYPQIKWQSPVTWRSADAATALDTALGWCCVRAAGRPACNKARRQIYIPGYGLCRSWRRALREAGKGAS